MRRLESLLIILALAAFVAFGAGMAASAPTVPSPTPSLPPLPTPPPASVLVEGTVGPVGTVDPLYAETPAERSISAVLYRGLVRLGPDGVEPDLAESWTVSADGSEYEFRLRPDARWHDGRHVTADDVVATLEALTDPAYEGPARGRWQGLTAERLDQFTVRVSSAAPVGAVLTAMTQPLIPAHLVPARPRPVGAALQPPVGNGPYAFLSATDDQVVLERWGPPVGGVAATYPPDPRASPPDPTPRRAGSPSAWFDRYRFRIFPDEAAVARAFEAGDVDVAAGLAPAVAGVAAQAPGVTALEYPTSRVLTLVPNLRLASLPFADAGVRRALSSAIDRQAIVDEVYGGAALPVRTPISPASPFFDEQASSTPLHDPEGAKVGLRAAGWTESATGWLMPGATEPVHIDLLVPDDSADPLGSSIAQRIASDWEEIGLSVDVVPLPPDQLVEERLRPGDFDVALLEVDVGVDPDLQPYLTSGQAFVRRHEHQRLPIDRHGPAPRRGPPVRGSGHAAGTLPGPPGGARPGDADDPHRVPRRGLPDPRNARRTGPAPGLVGGGQVRRCASMAPRFAPGRVIVRVALPRWRNRQTR